MAVTCTLPSATCHHRSHASPSAAWCPQAIPVTRTLPSTAHHHRLHVTVGRMVPPSSAHHPHIAVACMSPFASLSAAWCPQAMPITCTSPLTVCHHCLHVTIGRMVPPSSAHHPHIAVACTSLFASPLAAWCPQAMPVTHTSPSTTRHHCSHVTISRMVRPSNAHHPHVAIACVSPFASPLAVQCPQATPVTHTSPLPARHHSHRRRLHGAHEQRLSPTCRRRHGCATAVPNLKMLRVQFRNMM